MGVDGVFGDVEAEVIRLAIHRPRLDAAACHPHGVGVLVVVTAGGGFGAVLVGTLAQRGAAEFTAPDHEGFIEQAALLEVAHECGHGLVHILGLGGEALLEAAVVVPVGIKELHHAHAALDEPARQQAVAGKGGLAGLRAVHVQRGLVFPRDVHELRHAGLHAVGHFILADARGDLGISHHAELLLIERLHRVEHMTAVFGALACGIAEKEHRLAAAAKLDALVHAGQEAGAPERGACAARRTGEQNHVGGQVAVFGAEAIRDPCTEAGPPPLAKAGVQKHLRRGVVDLIGVQGLHHADVVRHGAQVRQQLAQLQAALAMALKFEFGARQLHLAADEGKALALSQLLGAVLAVHLLQQRLVVVQIQLRRRADHVQVNDVLGLGGKVGAWHHRCSGRQVPRQQRSQRHATQPQAGLPEKLAAGDIEKGGGVHGRRGQGLPMKRRKPGGDCARAAGWRNRPSE